MEMDYEQLMIGIVNNMRARAPKVSGNLANSIQYSITASSGIWGVISIDTPYSRFVNYGYINHPNSTKLSRDYLFVEKAIKNELKNVLYKYGGGYVK